jgi:hypothetical protein
MAMTITNRNMRKIKKSLLSRLTSGAVRGETRCITWVSAISTGIQVEDGWGLAVFIPPATISAVPKVVYFCFRLILSV